MEGKVDRFSSGRPNIGIYMNEECAETLGYNSYADVDLDISRGGIELEISEIDSLEYGKFFLKKHAGTFNSWCQDTLPPEYVKGEIETSNLIIILRDSDGDIRGIALLYVGPDANTGKVQMELLVLCSALRPASSDKQDKQYARGGDLLKIVQFLGRNLPDGIKLYALETVIPLYYRFGWRFIFDCKAQERQYIEDLVKDLAEYFKVHRFDRGDKDTEELENLLTGFRGRAKDIAELIRTGEAVGREAFNLARDNGFEMLLCRDKNPYNVGEGKADGYKRKRTRRRKKRRRQRTRRRQKQKQKQRRRRGTK